MTQEAQVGLWDREIEDQDLEYALSVIRDHDNRAIVREVNGARKAIKAALARVELREGERLRCGRFVLVGTLRTGGGIEIPAWESVGVSAVVEL